MPAPTQVTRHALAPDIRVAVALGLQLLAFAFATGGLSVLTLLRMEGGWGTLFFLFLCCWQADNGALFTGTALGRYTPRFLPTVSPNKSYAGVVGAVAWSVGSAYAFTLLQQQYGGGDGLAAVATDGGGGGEGRDADAGAVALFVRAVVPPLPFSDPATAAAVGFALGVASLVVRAYGNE
jgi:CDP-diglyceride synthetase